MMEGGEGQRERSEQPRKAAEEMEKILFIGFRRKHQNGPMVKRKKVFGGVGKQNKMGKR